MTSELNYHTYNEITSQPDAWRAALDITRATTLPDAKDYDQIVFTGCGSTYYLSLAAAALYQSLTGRPARAIPGGELLLNPQSVLIGQKSLLVAVSRSGRTTETVTAVKKFKAEKRGTAVVMTNYESPLSQLGDINIIIPQGQEESMAQTRSFASMYVAATAFSARAGGRDDLLNAMAALPAVGERLLRDFAPAARQISENLAFDRFYFLGSGIHYGLACEVNMKMKEMTLTHSEPFHFLEFRHGPMSMVNEKAVIVGLVSEANFSHEEAVLNEMKDLGGTAVALGETGVDIPFNSGIPESVRGVLYLPFLQLMAFYRSLAKGLNPDRPNNLKAVIQLNL